MATLHQQQLEEAIALWQGAYIKAIIDELHPSGDVLEVGFARGDAATQIQTYKPKSHTIIVWDPEATKAAQAWATKHPGVKVISDYWENALSRLGTFDTIYFNDTDPEDAIELLNRQTRDQAEKTAAQAKELATLLEKQLTTLDVHYSDKEIDDFYRTAGKANERHLPTFFKALKKRGHITEQQYQQAVKKYHLDAIKPIAPEPVILFLEECLQKHLKNGGRFSCYLNNATSRYEDPNFFERVVTNTAVDFKEKQVSIKVPACPFENGLVITVKKVR